MPGMSYLTLRRYTAALLLPMLLGLSLTACGGTTDSQVVDACWEHVSDDAENVANVPNLKEGKLKPLDTNASEDGGGWIAVGKADVDGATVEFGCVLDANLKVTESQFGPEGSIDTN